MTDQPAEKPKIIVDEDWKTQVESEREQQKTAPTESPPREELPPASFEVLISSLATQALAALGQFSQPQEGKVAVDLTIGKFQIDLLEVLQEKTKGNLTEQEAATLENVVHQLRMLFVSVQGSAVPVSEAEGESPSSIVTP